MQRPVLTHRGSYSATGGYDPQNADGTSMGPSNMPTPTHRGAQFNQTAQLVNGAGASVGQAGTPIGPPMGHGPGGIAQPQVGQMAPLPFSGQSSSNSYNGAFRRSYPSSSSLYTHTQAANQRTLPPGSNQLGGGPNRNRRHLNFESRSVLYGGAWAPNPWGDDYIALATYNEEANNSVHVLRGEKTVLPRPNGNNSAVPATPPLPQTTRFVPLADAMVTLPQTKVAWDPCGPSRSGKLKLLSTGDCLRIWELTLEDARLEASCPLAKKAKGGQTAAAPLTSFDWTSVDNTIAIASSIDTTCTLWDLERQAVRTQLIAHDSDVYDVAFLPNSAQQFVSAGADGSVRLFDLRSLDNSTIIYESSPSTPLLRIAPNPNDPNVLAAIGYQRRGIAIIDIRAPRNPLFTLEGHQAAVNGIAWAPATAVSASGGKIGGMVLASGGDDCQVLMWDLQTANNTESGGIVGTLTDIGQVNNVLWSPDGQYIASIRGKSFQALRNPLVSAA